MICKKCGYVDNDGFFCVNCGATLSDENEANISSSPIIDTVDEHKFSVWGVIVVLFVVLILGLGAFSLIDNIIPKKEIVNSDVINKLGVYEYISTDGVKIVLTTGNKAVSDLEIDNIKNILMQRIEKMYSEEYEIKVERNDNGTKFFIKIPSVVDADEVSDMLRNKLELKVVESVTEIDEDGQVTVMPSDNVVLNDEDIILAESRYGVMNMNVPEYYVELILSNKAVDKFANATERLVGSTMYICLDDEILLAPYVNEKIESITVVITGDYTENEAEELAEIISLDCLPFQLDVVSSEYVEDINK